MINWPRLENATTKMSPRALELCLFEQLDLPSFKQEVSCLWLVFFVQRHEDTSQEGVKEFPLVFLPHSNIGHDSFQSSCLFTATIEEPLFDKFLFPQQSVFRGLVFLNSAFSLFHPDSFTVDETVHICCMVQATRSKSFGRVDR